MSNPPARFKQIDVTRALKAAAAADISVGRFEIDKDGKIIVFSEQCAAKEINDWD